MIGFRVDTSCGLGHLMRMKWLALGLSKLGATCYFFVDSDNVPAWLLDDLTAVVQVVPARLTSAADADFILASLRTISQHSATHCEVKWIIVDGYQFDISWEARVKAAGYNLLAFDDIERAHAADAIVDAKWQGKRTFNRYMTPELSSATCQRLLGPDYAILAPEYVSADRVNRLKQLMFSLGGGGDWAYLTDVIQHILQTAQLSSFDLIVILGPYASNYNALEELATFHSQLQIVKEPTSLFQYYIESQLFIGALGTSLYELAVTNTPALTFSIAPNQHNDIISLAELGHYLHFDDIEDIPASNMAELISKLALQPLRLAALRTSVSQKVDGLGAERISRFLLGLPEYAVKQHQRCCLNLSLEKRKIIAGNLMLRPVVDKDINDYLIARNRPDNSWRMTITKKISRAEHYCWWFSQQRQSFALEQDGEVLLYLWQQKFTILQQSYWIGGWFAASDKVNFSHAQLVLDWQLKKTATESPQTIWLAVINKENKFVNLLNQRAGFVPLQDNSEAYQAACQLFPKADAKTFNFVGKWPTQGGT